LDILCAALVAYKAADFKASEEAIEWCLKQGGKISYSQYSYINGPDVIAFGNKKAYCNMGTYTLTEVETLASPFLTLAQMAYFHPIPNFKWDRKQYNKPFRSARPHIASYEWCQSGGAILQPSTVLRARPLLWAPSTCQR
jgi:hypothetical protein